MADAKISALTGASTPLAGTEVLPIVQSGSTVKVAVSNLTAGRAVSALSLNVNTTYAGAPVQIASAPGGSDLSVAGINVMGTAEVTTGQIMNGVSFTALNNTNRARAAVGCIVGTNWGYGNLVFYTRGAADGSLLTSADEKMRISDTGNITYTSGNLIPGTAAKGINFTANTPAAGMTSQLLNWYEEGTWTPAIGGDATYTTQTGRYTRVGRLVTFMCDLTINVAGTGDKGTISGLPFAASGNNPVYVGYFAGLGASVVSISPFVGGTSINLYGLTAAATTASGLNLMGNGARLMCQGSYEV